MLKKQTNCTEEEQTNRREGAEKFSVFLCLVCPSEPKQNVITEFSNKDSVYWDKQKTFDNSGPTWDFSSAQPHDNY